MAGERARALELHDLPQQHMLRRGPLSPKLLPTLAIMAADASQLDSIIAGTDPLQVCLHQLHFPVLADDGTQTAEYESFPISDL